MNLSAPFIRRPVMTTFLIFALLVAGALAYFHLPVTDVPSIETPRIYVSTDYPGASPEVVLHEITIPLEKELLSVKGVQEVSSRSGEGSSSITLTFDMKKDMRQAVIDVEAVLRRATNWLPKDLDKAPECRFSDTDQDSIMTLVVSSQTASAGNLRSLCENQIIPRLERIEGVANVGVFGEEKNVYLRLNPELMAARRVGFNDVIDAVKEHTEHEPLGSITSKNGELFFEWKDTVINAKDIENIVINKNNLFIKDLGQVSEKSNTQNESRFLTQNSSKRCLVLWIQKTSDGNAVSISKKVHAALAVAALPSNISINVWFDKADWINGSISHVEWSLALSFLLVVLIIYLSLKRLSEALVTCVSIPLSLLGTLGVMYCLDFSLDLLSLLALTLSCGFVIDDAIVMLENIARHKEQGESTFEAAFGGSGQICFTILAITLSLVAVFIPLVFMPGMHGRLFREFSCTLSIAIIISGAISLTIIPMLCSRFSTMSTAPKLPKESAAKRWYAATLHYVLHAPKTVLVISLGLFAASFFLFRLLPVDLIPKEDRGFLFIVTPLPKTPSQIRERQEKLEAMLQKNHSIENFISANLEDILLFAVRLVPKNERASQAEIVSLLTRQFNALPGNEVWIDPMQLIRLDMNFGNGGRYALSVSGSSFDEVENATKKLTQTLVQKGVVTSAESSLKKETPFLSLEVDEKKLSHFGFAKKDVQDLFKLTFGGAPIGSLRQGTYSENIYVELLPQYQKSIDAASKLYLSTPNDELIPLRAFASWKETLGPSSLHRLEGLPSLKIHFTLPENVPQNVALEHLERVARISVPDSIQITLSGSAKQIASAINDTLLLLLAAILVMYIILGILYESFIHPLTILSSVPFACLGGILTLLLAHEPLSIFSAVGFLLLIGIVKKNGIMMIDCALDLERTGLSPYDAIHKACLTRFRPIMMTTAAAIMGAIPIAIGIGESAEMLRGLGLVIVGGLAFSQVLTLYVTPVLYLLFDNLRSGLGPRT